MASNALQFLGSCLHDTSLRACFASRLSRSTSLARRVDHLKTRLRANLGMAERPSRFPAGSYESYATPGPAPTTDTSSTTSDVITQPRVSMQVRTSTTSNSSGSQIQWSTTYMSREELTELLNLLHETLSHVPYAICGLAALIDHGFNRRQANRISILCPQESKNIVKAWAATAGFQSTADSIGLPARDGSLRRVRIKYINDGFEQLERVQSQLSNATVLSPTSQLDNVAAGYLENRRRGDERALETVSKELFWCLGHISRPDPRLLPTFLGETFFADFTASYGAAAEEAIARAGIDIEAVRARHRDAVALREHDEMLRRYGLQGDVLQPPLAQFEHMRDLRQSKSVYTLRERRDSAAVAASPEPKRKPTARERAERSGRNFTAPARTFWTGNKSGDME